MSDERPDGIDFGKDLGRIPMPDWLVEHAMSFAVGDQTPAVPRLAATVILLRPQPVRGTSAGFQVYAVRRAATMAFAAGMYAFPGGGVDPSDSDAYVDWSGPAPAEWARRLGLPVGQAQAVVCAAVRELFEEAGVLLAGSGDDHVVGDLSVGDLSAQEWESARTALETRQRSLSGWFGEAGLRLRADLLVPWVRWLTPEFEPRRYDTFFFLARLPEDQQPREVGGEADHSFWVAPAEALGLPMLPPTRHTLRELSAFPDIAAILAASVDRDVSTPVTPRMELEDGRAYLRLG